MANLITRIVSMETVCRLNVDSGESDTFMIILW